MTYKSTVRDAFDPGEARDPQGEWTSGDGYPIAPKSEWHGEANYEVTGGKLVSMSPNEFLAHAKPLKIDETSRENIDLLKEHIKSGKTLDPLALYANGKEDGRHRAHTAKELGIASVPVITFRSVEPAAQQPLKIAELTKVGKQMGSNPGGVYADTAGKKFYVKQGKSADHVRNEMLSAKLYQLAGTPTLHYRMVEGGKHIATEMEPLAKKAASAFSPEEMDEARLDFVPHAWLANWDAVGLDYDNLGTAKDGRVLELDVGGALDYRAQGAPKGKAFGDTAGEIDSLRDPKVNSDSAHMFGGMTPAQLRESASFVTKITDQDIRKAVIRRLGHPLTRRNYHPCNHLPARPALHSQIDPIHSWPRAFARRTRGSTQRGRNCRI